jgi:hypothetical protein
MAVTQARCAAASSQLTVWPGVVWESVARRFLPVSSLLGRSQRTSLFKFRCTFVLMFGSEIRLTTSWLGVWVCVQVGSRGAFPPRVGDVAATTNPRDWCNTRASGGRLSEQLWSLGSGQACQQRLCVAAVFQQGSYGSILMKLRCQSNG